MGDVLGAYFMETEKQQGQHPNPVTNMYRFPVQGRVGTPSRDNPAGVWHARNVISIDTWLVGFE